MNDIKFRDTDHQQAFYDLCDDMLAYQSRPELDSYHKSLAYLLTLDVVCCKHIDDLYSVEDNGIIIDGLNRAWQTGTSRRTTRLAFNLWNGYSTDGEVMTDKEGNEHELTSPLYTPDALFCCEYAPYYYEAIKLRYPEYTGI